MTDLNTIRVIPICGKVDEWPIWSERFLAKSRRSGLKDLLLGKLSISTANEEINEGTKSGKKKSVTIELNEIAYKELILLIDVVKKLLLILLKDVKVRTTQMAMLLQHGKG
jgi:hypothetical protein